MHTTILLLTSIPVTNVLGTADRHHVIDLPTTLYEMVPFPTPLPAHLPPREEGDEARRRGTVCAAPVSAVDSTLSNHQL